MNEGTVIAGKRYALTITFTVSEDGRYCEDVQTIDTAGLPVMMIAGLLNDLSHQLYDGRVTTSTHPMN